MPMDANSIQAQSPPMPDIRCESPDGPILFELAEVLWEYPEPDPPIASLAHGLALSARASGRKAAPVADGRDGEAEQIQTCGGFGYPPLASLLQALGKKCSKGYQTEGHPVFLVLYYPNYARIEGPRRA